MDLSDKIKALPEQGATKSRDFGRGYSQAIKDVLALMQVEDELAHPATRSFLTMVDSHVSKEEVGMSLGDQALLREARASVSLDRDQTHEVT